MEYCGLVGAMCLDGWQGVELLNWYFSIVVYFFGIHWHLGCGPVDFTEFEVMLRLRFLGISESRLVANLRFLFFELLSLGTTKLWWSQPFFNTIFHCFKFSSLRRIDLRLFSDFWQLFSEGVCKFDGCYQVFQFFSIFPNKLRNFDRTVH